MMNMQAWIQHSVLHDQDHLRLSGSCRLVRVRLMPW